MAETETALEITPEEAAHRIEEGNVELVDVRTDPEHGAGHIAGDRHIPLDELATRGTELDAAGPIIFYCRSGDRSAAAAEAFRASGREATSIAGGLLAWADGGHPLEPEDGEVAERSNLPGH
jgi:rhodanese-related sulfurtransferase